MNAQDILHTPLPPPQATAPEISVVVPVSGMHDDPGEIHETVSRELRRLGRSFEFIFVADGGQEEAEGAIARLARQTPGVSGFRLGRRFGEATALSVGFRRARGSIVVTLNPYEQVLPEEIGKVLAALVEGVDLVVTRRSPRTDSVFDRLQSAAFHLALSWITGTRFHDISCGLRAMRGDVARALRIYGDQHRFIPVLAVRDGFRVVEIPVRQSTKERRWRVRSPGTYLTRLLDVLTVFFLVRFTKRPLRFFGSVGGAIFAAGLAVCLYLTFVKFAYSVPLMERPLLLLGVLMLVLGIQTASIGLLGEIIIFTHGQESADYRAEEIRE